MNKFSKWIALSLAVLLLVSSLAACSSAGPASTAADETSANAAAAGSSSSAETTSSIAEPSFTLEELATYDGQNGNPAYIAVEGVVYDVSDVSPWKGGIHIKKFKAGVDYTEEIKSAPHGNKALEQAVRVGVLKA